MEAGRDEALDRRRLLLGGVAGVGLTGAGLALGVRRLAPRAGATAGRGEPSVSPDDERVFAPALDDAVRRIRALAPQAEERGFPTANINGRWTYSETGSWKGGFWSGQLWLASLAAEDRALADAAAGAARRLAPRRTDTSTHDLGFLFYPSWVTAFRLTGDEGWGEGALEAADSLLTRFNPRADYLRAWGALDSSEDVGRTIIDTMMNLDLLFWASTETGEDRFASVARRHAVMSATHHVRDDGSTCHAFDFDPDTGEPIGQNTRQGYSPTSCWARGQAWAIYGFTTAYRRTETALFLDTAHVVADWFLEHLPADAVPYWDFRAPDLPRDVRDSSAGAIAACGLLDLARVTGERRYQDGALRTLRSLTRDYTTKGTSAEAILLHGTGNKPGGKEVDTSLVYGDYYFVEALMRLLHPEPTARAIGLEFPRR